MSARDNGITAAAMALFADSFGGTATGTWSAPGRVNLIGEHTDYNGGFVLPFAIQYRTHVALAPRSEGVIRVVSTLGRDVVDMPVAELPELFPARRDTLAEWARYPLGVAWALLAASGRGADSVCGVDLAFASDVPAGAGLSSSAAIEGATAVALAETWGLELDGIALARAGQRAENEAVGAPTGIMDQMASMLGREEAAIFLDCRSLDAQIIDLKLARAGLELLVVDTRVRHSHASGGYGERRAACERGAAIMGVPQLRDLSIMDLPRAEEMMDHVTFRRVRHVVTENQRVLDTRSALRQRGPAAIGELLVESHVSMRDDFEISVPPLDVAVDAAMDAGAVGARMTGGGFGGAAIALVPRNRLESVEQGVADAFAACGFASPNVFVVRPSQGAQRES